MEVSRSEDCLIFYGLTPKKSKSSVVFEIISGFMNRKQAIDPSDRFNFIAFRDDGPNYLDNFTLDPSIVLKTMKSFDKKIARANLAGGIFVAVTFIIDVFKKISEKHD